MLVWSVLKYSYQKNEVLVRLWRFNCDNGFFSIQFRGFSIGGDGDDSNGETAKKKQ